MKKILIVFLLITFSLAFGYRNYKTSQNLQIWFYDIGQGDSSLIKFPGNYTILVDGGPDNRILEKLGQTINPFNKNIDLVVATHNHADHTKGLNYVLDKYRVSQFVTHEKDKGVALYAGDSIKIPAKLGFATIKILWPPKELFSKNCMQFCDINIDDPNSVSLVFELQYKNFKALFTGDATLSVLEFLAPSSSKVDVVKIPHQGSKDSFLEEFYKKIEPKVSVISVGKNSYGHPSKEVVDFLTKIGSKVYKTSDFGGVKISTNGESWSITQGI